MTDQADQGWMDETLASFPFKVGQLVELAETYCFRYLRVTKVTPEGAVYDALEVGRIEHPDPQRLNKVLYPVRKC